MILYVVIPAAAGSEQMTKYCYNAAMINSTNYLTKLLVWDNGVGWPEGSDRLGNGSNVGVYPVFFDARREIDESLYYLDTEELILFIHNDLIIHEKGYDQRIIDAFSQNDDLGLVGFVGSSEICSRGGRGLGTMLNFQGLSKGSSPAEVHGRRESGLVAAAQVDGCAMAFRNRVLKDITFRENFPIHHFYDRLLSCEVLELGYHVAHLGIACDHLSGRTANSLDDYHERSRRWHVSRGLDPGLNPDLANYKLAENMFLTEWRDDKKFIPLRVGTDHEITRS